MYPHGCTNHVWVRIAGASPLEAASVVAVAVAVVVVVVVLVVVVLVEVVLVEVVLVEVVLVVLAALLVPELACHGQAWQSAVSGGFCSSLPPAANL
jgi:hypothetical protein